ncbi:MAG: hypothetical protein RLZ98_2086 [Pseudomonadota bacterium]|jgi:riboflavin-specific deaminase-like protein
MRPLKDSDDPCDFLRDADPDRPCVVAQLGQSLDGRIATPTGESRWINGGAALDHVHRIRANVDAVVVGVGTVTADNPLLTVRRVAGNSPARVVIDPSGRLPADARILTDDGVRRIVVHATDAGSAPEGVEVVALTRHGPALPPHAIVNALFKRGLRRILVEGGAWTVSQFLNADAVDRLHIMVAPLLIGSGKPGLSLRPIARLTEARRPETRIFPLPDGDVLFDCNLRAIKEQTS